VPSPFASYLTLKAVRETKGNAIAVEDKEIIASIKILFRNGLYACPEAAATLAALNKSEQSNIFSPADTILLYLTGNAIKNFNLLKTNKEKLKTLTKNAITL
ncbi:MAG: hypothetical protein QXJ94_06500, partial [Candidatus Bathyarchaeia archaeon]